MIDPLTNKFDVSMLLECIDLSTVIFSTTCRLLLIVVTWFVTCTKSLILTSLPVNTTSLLINVIELVTFICPLILTLDPEK